MKTQSIVIILMALMFGLLAGCSNNASQTAPSAEQGAPVTEGPAVTIDMTARNWEFVPDVVTVKQGSRVKLRVKSVDVTHGLSLPAFGVNLRLSPGKTEEVEFVADKVGSYVFSCSVPCGRGHGGMRGKIVVE